MAKPDPLKQAAQIKEIAESFIASRLSVSEAFQLAASVVLGEPEEKALTDAIGFRIPQEEEDEEEDVEDRDSRCRPRRRQ